MTHAISISHLSKTYASGFQALNDVSLDIRHGEIFALLGPNGAGKTTLISIVCGIVIPSAGTVTVDGHDIARDYRAARSLIGLVPQELTIDMFETPTATCRLSRGLKRRLMIAKALAHEPRILFLDEPTAGVDVELRKDMWQLVRALRASGVTIILTTHYIEEAEELADRVGVINKGELIVVEDKAELMRKLGRKQLIVDLRERLDAIPAALAGHGLTLSADGLRLIYTYDTKSEHTGITDLLDAVRNAGIHFKDLQTTQSSLEDIFVGLVRQTNAA